MKASVFVATSVDGFIARKDGSIDWLLAADAEGGEEDYGYQRFVDSIDCMVIGRKSLETVMNFPEWPYPNRRVIVLSHTLKNAPQSVADKIELHCGAVRSLYADLKKQSCRHLYIDGGETIQSFLREALIDNLTITRLPILLGDGIPLFGPLANDIHLKHISTQTYTNGFVQSRYQVVYAPQ